MQRQNSPDVELKLTVEFTSVDGEIRGEGTTTKISPERIYFLTPHWNELEEEQALDLQIHGLDRDLLSTTFRTLVGTGRVKRLDAPEQSSDGMGGVAAECRWTHFQR